MTVARTRATHTTLQRRLASIMGSAEATLRRSAPSLVVGDDRHFAVCFIDPRAEIVSVSRPFWLGSLAETARRILGRLGDGLGAGDSVITNDPFSGGTHVNDFSVLRGVEAGGAQVGYLMARVHTADFGGDRLGGYNPTALEIWAEAVRITPIHLGRAGRTDKDVVTILALNSRLPDLFRGDVAAATAALDQAARDLQALVGELGRDAFEEGLSRILDETEADAVRRLGARDGGRWQAEAELRHCCTGAAVPIRIALRVESGTASFDLAGSGPSGPGFVNSAFGNTLSAVLMPWVAWLGPPAANAGLLRRVTVRADEGSIVDARAPLATGWSPYLTARHIGSLADRTLRAAGLGGGSFLHWVADPAPSFVVPNCEDPECPFGKVLGSPDYTSRYSPVL